MAVDDPQDEAEALDDDELTGGREYPPERPLAVEDYGTTAAEERVPEPLDEFVKREEADRLRPQRPEPPRLIDPETIEGLEDESDLVAVGVDPLDVPLSEDDEFTGDESERDFATELEAPLPAEEAAIHIIRP
ncbi:MAG: hypothetical protein QOD92_2176 [Acidimicrobiaceae bacterium]|jgi:hypothetical protein